MRSQFPLFQSHLDLAHSYWEKLIEPGDWVIDATCGNGADTLKICQLALRRGEGKVVGMDIQLAAVESTSRLLDLKLSEEQRTRVELICRCHSSFPSHCKQDTIKLIVYNLGYLPKGNKGLTTHLATTLESVGKALELIQPGGAVSITCYPGHDEGKKEEDALLAFARTLLPTEWSVCFHRWMNRNDSPSLILIQKAIQTR
jgi:hypothetical protein